jgi:hypothetical protein
MANKDNAYFDYLTIKLNFDVFFFLSVYYYTVIHRFVFDITEI